MVRLFDKLGDDMQKIMENEGLSPQVLERLGKQQVLLNSFVPKNLMQGMEKLQEQIRESENYTFEEFERSYSDERERSMKLGKCGWVISQYANPRIMKEWYEHIENNLDEFVMNYFEEDNNKLIISITNQLKDIYIDLPYRRYYEQGIKAFSHADYMTAALYLFPLFDCRTAELVKPKGKRNAERYSNKGYEEKRKAVYDGKSFFSKRYLILDMFSSLIAYSRITFVEEEMYNIGSGNEPPYLNRNWLHHGRMRNEISRCDCVKLLNAISVLEYVCK